MYFCFVFVGVDISSCSIRYHSDSERVTTSGTQVFRVQGLDSHSRSRFSLCPSAPQISVLVVR